ncbi:PH domain-containing protein [Ponticoccus sp. SC2-23]|uniref:photosynthetic complex putative assembly protein PuhB n=1 Tax=Alexandriicola marinus TaxID=2081710 RepID=UPI000FD7C884|nr:photosynthetic complex putative assembly protein PuhB [Alexandriicola marinus]MBM1221767.1 PH domain-containing protein [Ponticoccus sp. SC6-9]MBM1226118.1 PH domain-containing protein [Ponticoccus sp. SC6-15]MBM1230714.1 PH domain-containing protein [Ponticoccus sp. SC6-38]MBM1235445.1 PH domain-containing protein [Ponticoccus sp. SC6-45]MBM1239736.1 PH domain-containing protein [Ponticoccus sp. SC6-49]MBM1243880.1 PH domain-containing protein [Ponticoccus sp. SC2-64]MBM1248969.1 PH doma
MSHHDDFNFEPVRGLPGKLPEDEHILWQGSPNPRRLAREALGLRWVAGYFAVLTIWRVGVSSAEFTLAESIMHAVPFVLAGVIACAILYGIAYVQARSTVYTLTNKRVAMRIGAALTMTLNLPYVCIGTAKLDARKDGTGTIAMELIGDDRLSYLMTWPHVRPWYMARTQPALRCIPDAEKVAGILADAAETRINQPQVAKVSTPANGSAVAAE